MGGDVACDEGAPRHDPLAAQCHKLKHTTDERRSRAASDEARRHLGMQQVQGVAVTSVGHEGDLIAEPLLETVLLDVVDDGGVWRHGQKVPVISKERRPAASAAPRKATARLISTGASGRGTTSPRTS